jgi:hypothetical protein
MLVNPGCYVIEATFFNHKGKLTTCVCGDIFAYEDTTREQLLKNARSWVVMAGLHNFGMRTTRHSNRRYWQEVAFKAVQYQDSHRRKVERDKAEKHMSRCKIDSSGHIVS